MTHSLPSRRFSVLRRIGAGIDHLVGNGVGDDEAVGDPRPRIAIVELEDKRLAGRCVRSFLQHQMRIPGPIGDGAFHHYPAGPVKARSEEHTSELQSLMRISYAVFCFTKTLQ